MEVNVLNDIKKKKRSKSKEEEGSSIIDEESPVKVADVDINKTVKDFKDLLYAKLNLSSQISRSRLGVMLSLKKDDKEISWYF